MSRPREKGSKTSFANLGLKPEEDKEFQRVLDETGLSARQVIRALVRQWVKEGGHGVLKYSTK
jgi:antitoxin component of RelBE/YafQ-DinJ toxin-antitoxin module